MRITKQAQAETRNRILSAAQNLFKSSGFERTTTRDIAREAGIATGTLFNYFPTKEAVVLTLANESLEKAHRQFERRRRDGASLEEDLFAHVACGLRKLKPHRSYLRPALEIAFGPVARSDADAASGAAESVRVDHLEAVAALLIEHGLPAPLPVVALGLYWTLYCGVLAHWVDDSSPRQEDTLALLDQSIAMFVRWLQAECRLNSE